MEELRQKSVANQLCNEENQRRHVEEMSLLREQNKFLQQRLEGHEREGQSHAPPTNPTNPTNPTPQLPPTFQTNQTHQSSRIHIAPDDEEDVWGHPFTDEIIATPLPSKWKGLTVKLYDGFNDPDENLNVLKTQMTLYTTDKFVWCKVFPATLQEGPLGWFTTLFSNFVGNFKVLTTKFTTQYATSRPHHTSSLSLLNVKQEKGETLRAFRDKFNKVCMGIRNLIPKIAMHHLVDTIRPGRFTESLIKRPTQNMEELRNRATKFMQIEDTLTITRIIQWKVQIR